MYHSFRSSAVILFFTVLLGMSASAKDTLAPSQMEVTTLSPDKANATRLFDEATLQTLASQPQWQHLIFYKRGKPEVISTGFYLAKASSNTRSFTPYDELVATLENRHDRRIVCQYPARYYWLSQKLDGFDVELSQCPDLPSPNQDLSLILVSSYLQNPASSFGHVLIKTSQPQTHPTSSTALLSSQDLLNDSYNFGARIPADENGVLYAIKGLFGVYDAGFAQAEFFKQDALYSRHEQRDMWEYVLNLDEFEKTLLNYHLYEAKSARFDYYFIKQNCGYRSGELLELISPVKTTSRLGGWYAPEFVFDQLVEHDATTSSNHEDALIRTTRYLPSQQTQLRQRFMSLDPALQNIINEFIRTEDMAVLSALDEFDIQKETLAIEFLLAHRNYQITQDNSDHHRHIKQHLIRKRFALPAGDQLNKIAIPAKPSPALGNKTSLTHVHVSNNRIQAGMALFSKDPLGKYNDINKRFEAMRFDVAYPLVDTVQNEVVLDEFVFLDMQQIEDATGALAGEPKLSWQLQTGARKDDFSEALHRPYVTSGIGLGSQFQSQPTGFAPIDGVGYVLLNSTLHDQTGYVDATAELGVRVRQQNMGVELTHELTKRASHDVLHTTQLTFNHALQKNEELRLSISHKQGGRYHNQIEQEHTSNEHDTDIAIGWHHYW